MTIDEVLDFWFAPGQERRWFTRDPDFDAAVRDRLLPVALIAREGRLDDWRARARGCLALVILLDQVPRNVFRDSPEAFASDAAARAVTRHALDEGLDRELSQVERLFLYLPLEHSEDLADQELSCRLIGALDEDPGWLDYALKHREIIARFGRFPHRNAILGRCSTAEEEAFLRQPGSSF